MMRVGQWIRILLISISIIALTACHSTHKNTDPSAVNEANAAYNNNAAEASGLGQDASFADQAGGNGNQHLANKNTYYFDFDKDVVHDQDKPAIEANADYLTNHARTKVMLEGHTDPRGSREYNIGLGERRAKAVGEVLTSRGVNPGQIRIVSYGAEKLAATGHNEAAYQQDRRAVAIHLQQ